MKREIILQRVRRSLIPFTVVSVLAVVTYLVTGMILLPILLVGGALAGGVVAVIADLRAATPAAEGAGTVADEPSLSLRSFLLHDRLVVRFAALLVIGATVFLVTWVIGYFLLPEGALRGEGMQPKSVLEQRGETLVEEWLGILVWNLTIPVVIPILGNLLLRIKGYPLGYLLVLITFVQYGLTIGTNSFAIPYAERMAPSLAIFARAAPYEMAGYLLVVAATYSLSQFEITDLAQGTLRRVKSAPRALSWEDGIGLSLALLVISLAGLREASMILAL